MSEPRRTGLLNMLGTSLGCQFVIPVYQRNYTWSAEKEVKQYLEDLRNVLKGKYKNHFLGIIIYLEKSIDFSTREFSVIDGQQRLTTTFLIIYAVKRILERAKDEEKVKQLEGQYLTNPYHSDKIKYKLKPLVSDDDVYRCIVENRFNEIEDEDSNIYKNFSYIENYINSLLIEGYTANDILLALDKLYVVSVPISEEDNAQKIFESINATGVKLTAADLIRNYLLMDLQSDIQELFYKNYWKKIEDNVSQNSKELEQFFRMYLAVKTYTLVPKNDVYRSFVGWNEQQGLEIEELFKDLLEYAQIYYGVARKDIKELPSDVQVAITDFRKTASDIPMSIIMEFYRYYRDDKISSKILGDLIGAINAYMIRRSICDMNSQNISRLFPALIKKIEEKCKMGYESIVQILNQEMVGNNANTSGSYMPTDKQMQEALYNANVYKRPALRIILDRLELHDNPAPVDLSKLSIEHLMPQTPTEEWLEELNTDEEAYYENLHRLGNLTLAAVHDNSVMGNMGWAFKNEVLKGTGHLTLNMELSSINKWNLDEIEKRTINIIERICEVYPYPDVVIAKDVDDSVIDENTALEYAAKAAIKDDNIEVVRKRRVFKTSDNKVGYVLMSSKMYPQGDKEKYWFGHREIKFNDIKDCEKQFVVLACRDKELITVKLPKEFIEANQERMNKSYNDDGTISHYHIVVFKNVDDSVTMLFSRPDLEEVNIEEYVVR